MNIPFSSLLFLFICTTKIDLQNNEEAKKENERERRYSVGENVFFFLGLIKKMNKQEIESNANDHFIRSLPVVIVK